MSRFFAASDSESTTSSSDSEEEFQKKSTTATAAFLFSDEEEDTKRVVRSAKDKRYEQLQNIMKNIRNSKKIRDFNKMETSFQELTKAYEKTRAVVMKEEAGITPRFYVRILVEMEDLINETWEDREGRKSMSKNNSKSLGALRQKFRKYVRDFEEDLKRFRENPDADEDEQQAPESEDEDFEGKSRETSAVPSDKSAFLKKSTKASYEDDEESDDSYWDNSSETESSSDSDEPGMTLRDTFRKKDLTSTTGDKKIDRKKKVSKPKKAKALDDDDDEEDDAAWTKVERGMVDKPKMFEKDAEVTHAIVVKKLHEIMAARGKKRTNRKEQIELLLELLDVSKEKDLGVGIYAKIKFAVVSAIFDYNPKISEAMKPEYWEKCIPAVEDLLDILTENIDDIVTGENVNEEMENVETKPYKVRGCFLSVVERMCEDFVKVLKSCDAHSNEYVLRLKDEPKIIQILDKAQVLVDRSESSSEMCRIYLKRIEHMYFKFDSRVIQQKNGEIDAKEITSLQTMDKLCKYIYSKDSTDRLRTHAILCHIYHHSIHDNWYEARDLMFMSHLQDTVLHADPQTQILYNRTMVQLGLCGFRHAEIKDAHNALLDIQMGGRSKELLAQGLLPQRHHERSSEQEKIEKQRQMPFHMHINLEMLECVYLVSAMLIEIPYMAAHEYDARRRMISKAYYQQLRSSERQPLVGPPESMREHIVAASRAMRNGDWRKCKTLIINEKMNMKVWDLFHEADKVRTMLGRKIQEESLRTYLFTYSKVYDSISVGTLAEMFQLEKSKVHAIVSKMIINEELMASLDEPTECMIMHRTEPSRLQSLSLQLADKVAQLVENNERLLDFRPGGWQANWRSKDDRSTNDRGGDQRDGRIQDRGSRNDKGNRDGRNKSDRKYNNNNNSNSRNWKNKINGRE